MTKHIGMLDESLKFKAVYEDFRPFLISFFKLNKHVVWANMPVDLLFALDRVELIQCPRQTQHDVDLC